jgi:hypothetical protein
MKLKIIKFSVTNWAGAKKKSVQVTKIGRPAEQLPTTATSAVDSRKIPQKTSTWVELAGGGAERFVPSPLVTGVHQSNVNFVCACID